MPQHLPTWLGHQAHGGRELKAWGAPQINENESSEQSEQSVVECRKAKLSHAMGLEKATATAVSSPRTLVLWSGPLACSRRHHSSGTFVTPKPAPMAQSHPFPDKIQ